MVSFIQYNNKFTVNWDGLPIFGEYMKFRGKAISGTSLIVSLGVIFAVTTIVAAIALSSMVSTAPRNVVQVPITLEIRADTENTYSDWLTAGDAIANQTYDFKVYANATWVGNYALNLTVSSTDTNLIADDVTIAYKIGNAAEFTVISGWGTTTNDLTFDLPEQTSAVEPMYAETYYFTIKVNKPISGVHLDFEALSSV